MSNCFFSDFIICFFSVDDPVALIQQNTSMVCLVAILSNTTFVKVFLIKQTQCSTAIEPCHNPESAQLRALSSWNHCLKPQSEVCIRVVLSFSILPLMGDDHTYWPWFGTMCQNKPFLTESALIKQLLTITRTRLISTFKLIKCSFLVSY